MGFYIRDIYIKNNTVLGPMAGVTNETFRLLCKEQGAGLVVAEMVSDKALSFKNQKTLMMTKVSPLEHPISMQIFGRDIESMVNAAKFLDTNSDCDIIDINMGCPVPKVAIKNKAGSALMKEPELVYDLVSSIVKAVKKPVTVKIRLGWDNNSINALEVAKKIEKAGASAIAVHGRTRAAMYSGKADWTLIKEIVDSLSIPVIGNGDVVDGPSAKKMMDETGCAAVMVARAAQGNPFLFREINGYLESEKKVERPSYKEIYDTIIKQHSMLVDLKGEHLANLEMRSHVGWYLKGLPGASHIRGLVCKEKDFSGVKDILDEYFKDYI